MREIKFRCWTNYEMLYEGWNGDFFATKEIIFRYDTVMQYTGLKDKNGKEIYEGDIVKANYEIMIHWDEEGEDVSPSGNYEEADGEVVFVDSAFRIKNKGVLSIYDEFEIIGNIYENPELIK